MKNRSPGKVIPPSEGKGPVDNPVSFNPTGTLRCRWSATVMTYEDFIADQKSKSSFWIVLGLLFIGAGVALIVMSFPLDGPMAVISLAGGIFSISCYLGLFIFIMVWTFHPRTTRQACVGLRNYRKDQIIDCIVKVLEGYDVPFTYRRKAKGPPRKFIFENGLKVKIDLTPSVLEPYGRILLRYKPSQFEEALDLQLFLDGELSKRKIVATKDVQ